MKRRNKPMTKNDIKELISIQVYKTYYKKGKLRDKKVEETIIILDSVQQLEKLDSVCNTLAQKPNCETIFITKYRVENADFKEWVYCYRRYYNPSKKMS